MKTASKRPVGFNKPKTIIITTLLLLIAFLSGAITERADNFLQNMTVIVPMAIEKIKAFFSEQLILKINTIAGCLKWGSIITILIFEYHLTGLIRGP